MKLWPRDDAVLTGGAHRPWPVPDCRCLTCRTDADLAGAGSAGATTGLTWGPLTLVAEGYRSGQDASAALRLEPGTTAEVAGARLLSLPAPGTDEVLVVGRGGRSLLWAPVAGALPPASVQALQDGALDAAVLDVRDADGRPDPVALAHEVARLRSAGALAPQATVVAVGWTHRTDLVRLAPLLSGWGVTVPGRAAVVGPVGNPSPWRTLVLGAASSGKSQYAEALLAAESQVHYVATAAAPTEADPEWAAKVARHRQRRPAWWQTSETDDLPPVLGQAGPPVLLDSLGTWTAAALGRCGAWDDGGDWQQQWEQEVAAVVQAWRDSARRVVAVGEETGWGVVPSTPAGRLFRDALGTLTRRLADESERVVLVVAGQPLDLPRGGGAA